MLTKADDYPIHQTPEPIAFAGSDRNFYDRYFFNGYTPDGRVFFAVALGVYPHLNIMDASVCVVVEGVQHNLHASRVLGMERMDLSVGPISLEVVEPLRRLRVRVAANDHGISGDILFTARTAPVAEPRFTYRSGPRVIMDYTRMTQHGTYAGELTAGGQTLRLDPATVLGTRDRSWGVRPVGAADSQPVAPPQMPQFYWLWAPCNFADCGTLYHINADATGRPWNTHAVLAGTDQMLTDMASCRSEVTWKRGTRHAAAATITMTDQAGGAWRLVLTPLWQFYMSGLGYMNPAWGHGHYKGPLAVGYEAYTLSEVDETALPFLHVQAFSQAELTAPDGRVRTGAGVLEQLVIGPFAPAGLTGLLDGAP